MAQAGLNLAEQLARAQQALQTQLDILQPVLDSIAEGVVVADETGKMVLFNRAAADILGVGLSDAKWEQWSERYGCFLPDGVTPFPPRELPLARAVLDGEQVNEAEVFIRHTGKPHGVWLSVNASPLRDQNGAACGGVAAFRDVTERKRAETELRNSEALYHSLVETMPLALYRKDREGRFTFINQRFCEALARPMAEILGKNDFDFYPPEQASKYQRDDQTVLQSGRWFEDVEANLDVAQGAIRYVQVIKAPVRDFVGRIVGTQGLFWDVTARREAEENLKAIAAELARSNEELQQFAYVVSHDLQEPLRMVAKFCELLKRRYHGKLDKSADEFIDFAVDGARRMDQLIQDLLAYSRVGTKGKPLAPTKAETVVERALANLATSLSESGAVVTHDPLPTVLADESQFSQLLQNLIGNAIKFRGAEAPRIHIEAKPADQGRWQFAVHDNGIGIDYRDQARIFGVFERLHAQTEYPGNGIGLAICKRIVERHGGRIWVKSHLGEGATFYFTLGH